VSQEPVLMKQKKSDYIGSRSLNLEIMVLQSDPKQISLKPTQKSLDDLETLFEIGLDEHSDFFLAHKHDRYAAAILSGVSGLDLHTFILKTEMNDVAQSVSEDDVKQLKKILWGVMIPYTTWNLKRVFPFPEDTTPAKSNGKTDGNNPNNGTLSETETWKRADRLNENQSTQSGQKDLYRFTQQNYILHLTVKISQSLNLIFELNQKRSFSALAIAAYAEAMVDVLTHPHLRSKVKETDVERLTHYLRRHPRYSNVFNIFTGHKLLRQFSMRASAPAANRKANDVWVQLNISATNMHNLLNKYPNIYNDFLQAEKQYTSPWHTEYYREVANKLKERLTKLDQDILGDAGEAEEVDFRGTISRAHVAPENVFMDRREDWQEEKAGVFLPQLSMQERNQLPVKTRRIVDALSRSGPVPQEADTGGEGRSFSLFKMFSQ
jgi:hypothetical protein